MCEINRGIDCCGIIEIEKIAENTPKQILETICISFFEDKEQCAYYFFSDIKQKITGKKLVKLILTQKLGIITKCPTKINPNTGNSLTMWIWAINRKALKKYWNKINLMNIKQHQEPDIFKQNNI